MLVPEVQAIALKKCEWLPALSSLLQHTHSPAIEHSGYFPSCLQQSSAWSEWIQALSSATYSAWIWSAADFLSAGDELILDVLVRLVQKLNQTSRAAVLPLAGTHGDTTAQQVCTWKTGFPLRQAIRAAEVDYQPNRYRLADVLKQHDCDAAVYITTFEPLEPPDEFWSISGVKIVIGHPALKCATRADYFFPTGIPGVDYDSHLFRGDNVSVVSIERKRESLVPSVADWFSQLRRQHSQRCELTPSAEN
jgi:formylmethanofuran dehydrogenase subunit B